MCRNFDFLKDKKIFSDFSYSCIEAEKSIEISPATCAILTRRALELAVKCLYTFDDDLVLPYQDNISSLIYNNSFKELINPDLFPMIRYIIKLGNVAVHTNAIIKREEAITSLRNLYDFVSFLDYCYADSYTASKFDESLLEKGSNKRERKEKLQGLYKELSFKDKKLEEERLENKLLRDKLTEKRKTTTRNFKFNVDEISEFKTRKRYIDVELKLAGWEFNKDIEEEVEVYGMPNQSGIGYADYVLYGDDGKPLAVVEAKRTSKDPKIGQHQAKLYADCLEEKYKQRPMIFYTNGFETYIWDDFNNYPPRRVSGFFTKDELQLFIDRRFEKKDFKNVKINDNISNRYYQKEAILSVCDALSNNQRKMLLVMATGSGKTRTAISIVDILMRHNWIKNILFLADRKALVTQAKKNFAKLLPNLSLCSLLDNKDNPEQARMIFSTYPTMMNAIDDTKTKDGEKLFTPGHFDLIIVDESHRSIYKKYKAIFDYFDSLLLGLTATPKDEIDKNTYSVFDLESGVPTFAYELKRAVEDGFLVDYDSIEFKTKIMESGVKYDDLSDEDKEQFEETFYDDENVDKEISNTAINNWLFNAETIDLVLEKLLEDGLRVEGGDKLGKTIIFAKNTKHAQAIVDRFNKAFSEYGGDFAKVVDYSVKYVSDIIDDFSNKEKMPQIAVSVDMLDTGIDIPEILNLVFFKKVRSKSKFWQMIGRGTRLCEDLLGVGIDKEKFRIFDFCNNFEFFRVNPKGFDGAIVESLTERIFNKKVYLIKELQNIKYDEEEYINYRKELLEDVLNSVANLDEDNFRVKMNLQFVHRYKSRDIWNALGDINLSEIREYISPLINSFKDEELAKRFDLLMYTIELSILQGMNVKRNIRNVIETAEELSKLGTIPEIQENKETIQIIKEEEFWKDASIFELEEARVILRELLKYLEKKSQKIYYTNFDDFIIAEESNTAIYEVNDLKNYRKKVEHYLKEHKDDLVIGKLRKNKKLTKQDIEELENIMWNKLGTSIDYEKEFGDMPVGKLVRKLVGLDRQAANEAFSEFLNDKSLNVNQLNFVKLIVDYIVVNGFIEDNRVLQEDPFRTVGSITTLFKDNMDDARKIIKIINNIKINTEVV